MEFLAGRRASVHWTPMDHAGWAVTVNKLRCIALKTHTYSHVRNKEREQERNKRREKETARKERITDANTVFIYFSIPSVCIYFLYERPQHAK